MNETELIELSKKGEARAFEKLIKPYEARLYLYLAKMCNNPEAAQDMAQETFINIFRKIKDFKGGAKFSTWIFQIAINNCLMLKRRDAKRQTISLDDEQQGRPFEVMDRERTPAKTYAKNELQEIIDTALQKLDPIYRSVFILSDIDGFTGPEIAKILSITLPNVKARLRRTKEQLRKILTPSLLKKCCEDKSIPECAHKNIVECIRGLGTG
ncbi:MAG: sigma-70 family RNA polymerase sigma factor [Candidatus Margulisiibacteriota bacterium]